MKNIINTTATVVVRNTTALTALKNDIRRYPLFSVEEEVEAFEALAAATTDAERAEIKTRIANANLRFVLSVAQKFTTDGDKVAELVSVGTIGLYNAIDTFDVSRGFKFITYAIKKIRAEFSEYFRTDANSVRRSNNALVGSKDKKAVEIFLQREYREPTEDELLEMLQEEFGVDINEKVDIVAMRSVSIDERVNGEDESTFADTAEFNDATASRNGFEADIEREHLSAVVSKLLTTLPIKERQILEKNFGLNGSPEMTMADIAEEFGCTEERVRQIIKGATAKLRTKAKKALSA